MKKTQRSIVTILMAITLMICSATIAVSSDPLAAWKPDFDPSRAEYTYILSNVAHPGIVGIVVGYKIRDKIW